MHFRQLRIAGFKSFVDPVDVRIEPGLTGVVGPNGCGKSNLFESVRWVMGATSAKALRGAGMEDVIFNGTGRRPARNHAEVTLVIENPDRTAPQPYKDEQELEISRRITRGGGSAYKINGKEARAKDVQLLFADASSGANSPALVRQGQISELVSAKPQNRRRVLEEAAGIAGLHARRHEAELKLRAAETNLDRVDEELARLEGELARLKRQARQAVRYKRLAAEIRRLEALIQHLKWTAAGRALDEAETGLRDIAAAAAAASSEAAKARTAASEAEAALPRARNEEAEAGAILRHVQTRREALERDLRDAEAELQRLNHRIEEIKASRTREEDIARDAGEAVARLTAEAEALSAGAEDEAERIEAARLKTDDAAEAREDAEAKLSELTTEAAAARARRDAAHRAVEQLESRAARLEQERAQAKASLQALDDEAARGQLDLFREQLIGAQKAAETARAELDAAEHAADLSAEAAREAEREFNAARSRAGEIRAERHGLERALASDKPGDWEPALSQVRAEAGFERALAAALGDDLNAALDAGAKSAWTGAADPGQALPEGAEPLSTHVEAPLALAARLSQVGVIEGDGDALRAALKPGQRLVSMAGDLWRWDGFVTRAGAPSPAAARLEQRTRLKALGEQLSEAEAAMETAEAKRNDTAEANRAALERLRAARAGAQETGRAVNEARETLDQEAGAAAASERRRAALEDRLARLNDDSRALASELTNAKSELEDADSVEIDDAAIEAARAETSAKRHEAAEARAAYDAARGEANRRKARLSAIAGEREDWIKRGGAARGRLEDFAERLQAAQQARDAAMDKPAEVRQQLDNLSAEVAEAETRAKTAADALAEAEAQAHHLNQAARKAEADHARLREDSAAAQQKRAGAEERLEERRGEIQKNLECEPGDLPKRAGELMEAAISLESAEAKLEQARRGRDSIGEVNLRAEIESEEIETQRKTLEDDRQDLVQAIAKLRKGVDALNDEGRARLLEAFDVINAHFQSLFQTLFDGGEAHLELTESDDPLEAGLEIYASPPGKRLAALSLMSGGEQALTASALIFAVFLSNPSPLCVLDEVDAPLDDANVGRFCDMLDEMTRRTQTRFLIITHNPVTMSRVDRLYGVTMAEQGVSQIVSVDLARAEQLAAAE